MTWMIKKSLHQSVIFTKNLLTDPTKDLVYLDFDPYIFTSDIKYDIEVQLVSIDDPKINSKNFN